MTATTTPAAVLAATIKQLSDEHTAQQAFHGTEDFMIVDDGKKRAALHAAIDQLREMAEGEQVMRAALMSVRMDAVSIGGKENAISDSTRERVDAALAYPVAAKQAEPTLTKNAKVGNGIFNAGCPERHVIEAAQRQWEHSQTPEGRAERAAEVERGAPFLAKLQACGVDKESLTTEAHAAVAPDGWVMVPRDPTERMICAGIEAYQGKCEVSYRAMLDAAPTPPSGATSAEDNA